MMAIPKVFSLFQTSTYDEIFPNIQILGKKVDFFLECATYNVIIPVKMKAEKKLDIFEEAVLKLIAYKAYSRQEIPDILCLSVDLINFIVIRLQEINFLEKRTLTITDIAKTFLNTESSVNKSIDYIQAKLFILKKTGEILPYIHKGEFISENVSEFSSSSLTLEYGTVGNPIKIKGKRLRADRNDKTDNMLQSGKIRNALKRFNLIVKENPSFDSIEFDRQWAVENTYSENVYFHMQAVVQKGNIDEILISDGLVANIDFINKYIKNFHLEFKSKVQELATKNVINDEGDSSVKENNSYKPRKYLSLKKCLDKIEKSYSQLTIQDNLEESISQDIYQEKMFVQKNYLMDCYSAFEWCLFYHDYKNPLEKQMYVVISNQSAFQNKKTIIQMAEKLGIRNPSKYEELFSFLDEDRMKRMYKSKVPELRVAISIAIIGAAKDETNLMRNLLNKRKNFMYILKELFLEHGDLTHQTKMPNINKERNNIIYDLLKESIEILLPDFFIEERSTVAKVSKNDVISQERLNAEVSLSKELGYMYFYNIISRELKNEWIQISPDKQYLPEPSDYVNILYRIMQDTLYQKLIDIQKDTQLKKNDILNKIHKLGINSKSFDKVNEKYVTKILKNTNSTLGANAMVYLYYQEENYIRDLISLGYVSIVEKLSILRMHGNNVALNVDTNELNKIRRELMNIVKKIGGA